MWVSMDVEAECNDRALAMKDYEASDMSMSTAPTAASKTELL